MNPWKQATACSIVQPRIAVPSGYENTFTLSAGSVQPRHRYPMGGILRRYGDDCRKPYRSQLFEPNQADAHNRMFAVKLGLEWLREQATDYLRLGSEVYEQTPLHYSGYRGHLHLA